MEKAFFGRSAGSDNWNKNRKRVYYANVYIPQHPTETKASRAVRLLEIEKNRDLSLCDF